MSVWIVRPYVLQQWERCEHKTEYESDLKQKIFNETFL